MSRSNDPGDDVWALGYHRYWLVAMALSTLRDRTFAATEARKSGQSLAEVLAKNPALAGGDLKQIEAADYVGQVGRVVETSVLRWQELRREVQ